MLPQNLVPTREDQTADIRTARDLLEQQYPTTYETTTLNDMTLHDDATVEYIPLNGKANRLPFTQGFLESLAKHIRMPLNYAYDIYFNLFRENFHRRKAACSCGLTLCIVRGAIVNTAPANYENLRAPNLKILDMLNVEESVWQFKNISLSDEGISINFLHPTGVVEPKPGDTIRVGIRVTNSETGGRYAKVTAFTERLVCSNGAVMPDSLGTVWWSTDRRMHETTKLNAFRKKTLELLQGTLPATIAIYDGIRDRQILQREFVHLFRRMNYALHSGEQADRILGIATEDRVRVQTHVRELEPGDHGEATPWLVFDLHNRVTAGARQVVPSSRNSRFSLRERLEEIGGDLLLFGRN